MMEITIKTSAENIEMANFILAQGYQSAINNEEFQEAFRVTPKQLLRAERFRKALLSSFTNKKSPMETGDGKTSQL